jgi:hypothetical protein
MRLKSGAKLTFFRLDLFSSETLNFVSKDNLRLGRAVDTAGLDTDQNTTFVLEEHVRIETDDTGLIGLGNVGEDDVDHGDEESVFHGVL